jgi:integrase
VNEKRRNKAVGDAAKAGQGTLEALMDLYGQKDGAALTSWPASRKRVEVVFARLLKKPVADLKALDFQLEADNYSSKNSAAFAVRTIRPVLKWASVSSRAYLKPEVALIQQPAHSKARQRVLGREELARLLPVLKASARPHAALFQFLLLTLARRDEAARARWRDVDMVAGLWTIPDAKNTKPGTVRPLHVVPLSRQAMALLASVRPESVAPDALVFATGTGTALGQWDRETKRLMEASETEGWHRHDLRRTGAIMLGEIGVLPDIIEAALNHVTIHSIQHGIYNQSRYRPEVADALQRLADVLDGIEAGGAKIIPLNRPAAP